MVAPAIPALRTPLPSPTSGGAQTLLKDTGFGVFAAAPVSFDAGGAPLSFAPALAAARDASRRTTVGASDRNTVAASLMWEDAFYGPATSAVPDHVVVAASRAKALKLFRSGALLISRWTFNSSCQPELSAAPRDVADLRPVFQGEVKSVDKNMLGQALYYTLMSMSVVFFPAELGAPAGAPRRRVYYTAPPVGFALLAFPHVGYFASFEMAGKVLVSTASQSFFLGSDEHRAATAALPSEPIGPPAWQFDASVVWRSDELPPPLPLPGGAAAERPAPLVAWAFCADGWFRKLVRADARSADEWAEMCAAYAELAPLLVEAVDEAVDEAAAVAAAGALGQAPQPPRPPSALVRGTRLLFGAHEVLVEMRAIAGARTASDEETTGAGADAGAGAGAVVAAVATALAWLAAHRIIYTDVRGPNVLVRAAEDAEGHTSVWLVDYDDCVVIAAPVRDTATFRAALLRVAEQRAARRAPNHVGVAGFAERFAGGQFPALEAALDIAFAALP